MQSRFVERQLPAGQGADLVLVDVDAHHSVAQQRHADGVRGAEVPGPDDGQGKACGDL